MQHRVEWKMWSMTLCSLYVYETRVKLCKRMLVPFLQRPPGTHLPWNRVGCSNLLQQERTTQWGMVGYLSKRVLAGTSYRIWACLRWFGDHTRKEGFALFWMLSGNGSKSVTGQCHNSYLEGHKDGVRLKPWLVKTNHTFLISNGWFLC